MLVLTRKRHEQICIGDNIRLTILRIKGNSVRVGIEAPRQVHVVRGELPRSDSDSPKGTVRIISMSERDPMSNELAVSEDQARESHRLQQLVRRNSELAAVVADAV